MELIAGDAKLLDELLFRRHHDVIKDPVGESNTVRHLAQSRVQRRVLEHLLEVLKCHKTKTVRTFYKVLESLSVVGKVAPDLRADQESKKH